MLRALIITLSFCFAPSIFAQSLSQFSTAELLTEVARRIDRNSGGGSVGNNIVSLNCENHELVLQIITRQAVSNRRYYNTSSSACVSQLAKLQSKIPNSFNDFVVVSVCDNHELVTLRLNDQAEITEINRTYNSGAAACIARL